MHKLIYNGAWQLIISPGVESPELESMHDVRTCLETPPCRQLPVLTCQVPSSITVICTTEKTIQTAMDYIYIKVLKVTWNASGNRICFERYLLLLIYLKCAKSVKEVASIPVSYLYLSLIFIKLWVVIFLDEKHLVFSLQ